MLIPPASSVGDFVRDIGLFCLIEIVEMPRQIRDSAKAHNEQKEGTFHALARKKV